MDDDELLLDDHSVNKSYAENVNQRSIESIHEWFLWSYLNILCGGFIATGCSFRTLRFTQQHNYSEAWSYLNIFFCGVTPGFIAIGCSLRTLRFKQQQNYQKAYKWSYITLFVNCITTLNALAYIGYLILQYQNI
ncbi:unnamed protein product [Adineta steineri]|uniref:Uncharacterized protein n=1 Tax=Adineta steineri TaxID=433720 RepID=A0A816CZ42_9BILA|nr:unnamed protein product [Adineta steineri]CAF1627521.1 unnamed protein product [Adineta steineri]